MEHTILTNIATDKHFYVCDNRVLTHLISHEGATPGQQAFAVYNLFVSFDDEGTSGDMTAVSPKNWADYLGMDLKTFSTCTAVLERHELLTVHTTTRSTEYKPLKYKIFTAPNDN